MKFSELYTEKEPTMSTRDKILKEALNLFSKKALIPYR